MRNRLDTTQPLIKADWVKKGTHITAVRADSPGKQELDENIIPIADLTCVAVQDIKIALCVYNACINN